MSNTHSEISLLEDPFAGDLVIDTFDAVRNPADALAAGTSASMCYVAPVDPGDSAR